MTVKVRLCTNGYFPRVLHVTTGKKKKKIYRYESPKTNTAHGLRRQRRSVLAHGRGLKGWGGNLARHGDHGLSPGRFLRVASIPGSHRVPPHSLSVKNPSRRRTVPKLLAPIFSLTHQGGAAAGCGGRARRGSRLRLYFTVQGSPNNLGALWWAVRTHLCGDVRERYCISACCCCCW